MVGRAKQQDQIRVPKSVNQNVRGCHMVSCMAATEFPVWRCGELDTSSMVKAIEKSIVRFDSLPHKKRSKMLGACKLVMEKEFVFSVARIEGEGLDYLEEVGVAIDSLEEMKKNQGSVMNVKFDKVKLTATLNLYKALRIVNEWGAGKASAPFIDVAFIKALHKVLGENSKEDQYDAGNYRNGHGWTFMTNGTKHEYMNFKKIPSALEHLIQSTNSLLEEIYKSKENKVVKLLNVAGWFFYSFEAIHPFRDGNGRVGRLLVAYLLCHIVPWGHNNLYMSREDSKQQLPVFVEQNTYLRCFETLQECGKVTIGSLVPYPADLIALLVEGVYVGWMRFLAYSR